MSDEETPLVLNGRTIESISIEQLEHLATSDLSVADGARNILDAADNGHPPTDERTRLANA